MARACPGTWSRWGLGGAATTDYLTSPHGHGWSVDRAGFEQLLARRAVEAGADFKSGRVRSTIRQPEGAPARPTAATSGASSRPAGFPGEGSRTPGRTVTTGSWRWWLSPRPEAPARSLDSRLIVEAGPDGWAYGVAGPDDLHCVGVVTDAEALAGSRPNDFATRLLAGTERLAAFAAICPTFQAVPVHCRWLPVRAGQCSVRIGDAQASFDPVAGRGLWEAIRMAEAVAVALDTDPDQLDVIEDSSARRYRRYLADRREYYRIGLERFGTGFWERRCAVPAAGPHSRRQAQLHPA